MGHWNNFMQRSIAAYRAFRNQALVLEPHIFNNESDTFENRRIRYAVLWHLYQGTFFGNDTILHFVREYKKQKGLYHSIREIYNPSYRSIEFWRSHLWGGPINFEDLDNSAIPIKTENQDILPALEKVYNWSEWSTNKDVVTLWGPDMGDVGIKVVHDAEAEQVYFEVIHPASVREIKRDSRGHIKAYTIEETRESPNNPNNTVTYREEATRGDEGQVIVQTFVNDSLFDWSGDGDTIELNYGFIPMVMIQHNPTGGDWGLSEMHPSLTAIDELNDLMSKLDDQIRKVIDPIWLMTGATKPDGNVKIKTPFPQTQQEALIDPHQARQAEPFLYEPNLDAKAFAMVADLNIADTLTAIDKILAGIERNHPELQQDIFSVGTDLSGVALIKAREPVVTRVKLRRVGYDNGLKRANQMSLTIGGLAKLEDFPFNADSFKNGELDHGIKDRPVFDIDPMDVAQLDKVQAEALKTESETITLPPIFLFRQQLLRDGKSKAEIDIQIKQVIEDASLEDRHGFLPPQAEPTPPPADESTPADEDVPVEESTNG